MAILFVFLLGVGNFALHRAVLASGHPLIDAVQWLVTSFGGRGSLIIEFAVLLGALLLTARSHPGWAGAYLGYSLLNAISAWLILSRRI